ncbi:MAG: haloacid dehalogenase type II [SAR324 cluster bacterium]|nr:haloacid dehalogenase type II [SAR324 cluster bacterium]
MNQVKFEGIKACVYDAYGTLFDVHSAVGKYRERLGDKADAVSNVWRMKQLEYTWLRSLMENHADFWQVTREALEYSLDANDVDNPKLLEDLMDAYLHLECYPEVKESLSRLKQSGAKNVILSNGSPMMLEAAVQNSGIGELIDQILSVEAIKIYKPSPLVYQLATDGIGILANQVSFQSSNSFDVAGAANFGFRVAWINRFGQRKERLPAGADAELKSLTELPALLGL